MAPISEEQFQQNECESAGDRELFFEAERLYTKKRFGEAFARYSELSEKGYCAAQVFLGWMYSEGIGTEPDRDVALFWFKKAAQKGSAEGMFYCGRLLEEFEKYDEAFEYIRLGAVRNYAPALCRLGLMYSIGRGVTENKDFAVQYLRRAAEQGNVFAKRELAVQLIMHSPSLLKRVEGVFRFALAITESFFVALRNPHSEKTRC